MSLERQREPVARLGPRNSLDSRATLRAVDPTDVVAQVRHDPAEVEVSPLSLTMAVDRVHLPSTVPAARNPVGRRDIDDDAILVELDAEDSGGLESEEDSEYARGAHWGSGRSLVWRLRE